MRGQLSAEMLILLALIIGLAFIIFSQMSKTVNDVSNTVDKNTQVMVDSVSIKPQDYKCTSDSQCQRIVEQWTCSDEGVCEDLNE